MSNCLVPAFVAEMKSQLEIGNHHFEAQLGEWEILSGDQVLGREAKEGGAGGLIGLLRQNKNWWR